MNAVITSKLDLLSVSLLPDFSLSIQVSTCCLVIFGALALAFTLWRKFFSGTSWKDFEIDQAEIGIGSGKIRFKPNMTDRQVAYAIWVELSTRKIGLPIDFDHDVIAEIYDSWYSFFAITRDLVKSIPVMKVRNDSTQKIIKLSIEVLNKGLRPHLTIWQARFRRWYEYEINKESGDAVIDPQDIQKNFPKFTELKNDMEQVNQNLIRYRQKMSQLVLRG